MKRMDPPRSQSDPARNIPEPHQASPAAEFDRLLREHVHSFFRSAYRWTGTVERAEDLVQELLVRLYPRLDELRKLDRVGPWAVRVMYRIFVDQLRRERSSPVRFGLKATQDEDGAEDDYHSEVLDPGPGPPELTDRELTEQRILAAWHELSEEHRMVLSLHDIEDYSLPELAQITQLPIGTLKSRLHRARARLRELLRTERISGPDRV